MNSHHQIVCIIKQAFASVALAQQGFFNSTFIVMEQSGLTLISQHQQALLIFQGLV
jgi:hypothetical protein